MTAHRKIEYSAAIRRRHRTRRALCCFSHSYITTGMVWWRRRKNRAEKRGGHTGVAQWSRGKAFIRLTVGHRVLVHSHTQRHCHEMYIEMLTPPYIIGKHALLECSKRCCTFARAKTWQNDSWMIQNDQFQGKIKAFLLRRKINCLQFWRKANFFW